MLIPTVVLMSELLEGESPAKIIVKALFTTCNKLKCLAIRVSLRILGWGISPL